MTLYIARRGNGQFYIQKEDVERYAELGYQIFKTEEVPVTDIKTEMEEINHEQS